MTATPPLPPTPRRIVLVAGPSGSGKGTMSRRSGLPLMPLDEFYLEGDDPSLPHRFGIVDWDDPASWNNGAALEALTSLAHDGVAEVPIYSIPESRLTGSRRIDTGSARLIVAEGIFAADLIGPLRAAGLLADVLVVDRPAPLVFALRLLRDLREARKPPLTLLRRGWAQAREQRANIRRWLDAGMRPVRLHEGLSRLRALSGIADAEQHHSLVGSAPHHVLRIAALCFLRDGHQGTELLAVRKRGTGSYMQVGGKLDASETPLEAAVREAREELGVALDPAEIQELGAFEAVAANEPSTVVHSHVFVTRRVLPDPLDVRAELADHRWIAIDQPVTGTRLAPLMAQHILPALRAW